MAEEQVATTYENRAGADITVLGLPFRPDYLGGNLSAMGLSTGAACWPSALVLARYLDWDCPLLGRSSHLATSGHAHATRVVELGCGLGLAGLVAATLLEPGGVVELTDSSEKVVEMASASAERLRDSRGNAATPIAALRTSILRWGDDEAAGRLCASGGFDLVIASDILYDPSLAEQSSAQFVRTVDLLLRDEENGTLPKAGATPAELWHRWIDRSMDGDAGVESSGQATGVAVLPPRRPICVVAFQRRGVELDVLLQAFQEGGFEYHVPSAGNQQEEDAPEGYYQDIFGNEHEDPCVFWQSCVCCFTRVQRGVEQP